MRGVVLDEREKLDKSERRERRGTKKTDRIENDGRERSGSKDSLERGRIGVNVELCYEGPLRNALRNGRSREGRGQRERSKRPTRSFLLCVQNSPL